MQFATDALAFLLLHVQDSHGFLLLTNDPLALLDETATHRIGNTIGGRFVGLEDAFEQVEVVVILLEKLAGQDVAQHQHNPQHFLRVHAARDDTPRQVVGVGFKGLDAAGFHDIKVIVVDGLCFRIDLPLAHGGKELGILNAPGPFLA